MVEAKTVQEEYAERIDFFSRNYAASDLFNDADKARNSSIHGISEEMSLAISSQAAGWCYQFNLLAKRNFLNLVRLPQTSYVKFIVTVLTAAFCIILFYNVGDDVAGV